MKCSECYWCALNHPLSDEVVCCNKESEHYDEVFPERERDERGCEAGQTKREVDYRYMNAWEFASKYYM